MRQQQQLPQQLVAHRRNQPALGHPWVARGRPAVGSKHTCPMRSRFTSNTNIANSPTKHCILPFTKAEAPCRQSLAFPAAEASLHHGHAPSREQPLASGRTPRTRDAEGRSGVLINADATIRPCTRHAFRNHSGTSVTRPASCRTCSYERSHTYCWWHCVYCLLSFCKNINTYREIGCTKRKQTEAV